MMKEEPPPPPFVANQGVSIILEDFGIEIQGHSSWMGGSESAAGNEPLTLLQPVTASIPAGTLFGILGGSGSGKTTLLNAIAGRYDQSSYRVLGSKRFLRKTSTASASQSCSVAYVAQEDFLHPYLTVRETFLYAAWLRLGVGPLAEQAVDSALLDLGLKECALSLVGSSDGIETRRGISGGERRRVSIGIQILNYPEVLCADEPTSGLDAFTAITVMECLQRLTQRQHSSSSSSSSLGGEGGGESGCYDYHTTILCSIHQPRADIFHLFHAVLLLSAGGQPVFCGPVTEMLDHFDRLGYPCPEHANPADYYIDLTAIDRSSAARREESEKRLEAFLLACQDHSRRSKQAGLLLLKEVGGGEVAQERARPSTSWARQCAVLTHRLTVCQRRDWSTFLGSILQSLFEGVLIMGIFWQLPLDTSGISSRSGLAYISISAQYYLLMLVLVEKYCRELSQFVDRELQDGLYASSAYYIAHWAVTWPVLLLQAVVYALPIYWGCGLRDGASYCFIFLAVHFALALTINALSWSCVTLQRDFSIASLLGNMSFTFLSLSAGFLVNPDTIPVYVSWVQNISILSYAYRLVMTTEFSHRTLDLSEGYSVQGDDVLNSYGVAVDDYTVPWTVLLVLGLVYFLVALVAFSTLRFPPTGSVAMAMQGGMAGEEGEEEEGSLMLAEHEVFSSLLKDLEAPAHHSQHDGLAQEAAQAAEDEEAENDHDDDNDDDAVMPSLAAPPPPPAAAAADHRRGMVIEARGVFLNVMLQGGRKVKPLLDSINLQVSPGRLVAMMGGSGSGKTTLLSLLANRIPQSSLALASQLADNDNEADRGAVGGSSYRGRGEILFNHRLLSSSQLRAVIGFVQQFDYHLPSLTVTETLHFQARLRLPAGSNFEQRVREVLRLLNLTACAHVQVGGGGGGGKKGISGGERRRVSIAVQLLADPAVCLLDEPTTGLDAHTARRVVLLLRHLAHQPHRVVGGGEALSYRTILLSIHQPRYDIFACFDDVLLLSRGQVVWAGPVRKMYGHFRSAGWPFPALCNPADYLLDISSIDFRSEKLEEESRDRLRRLVVAYKDYLLLLQKQHDEKQKMPAESPAGRDEVEGGNLTFRRLALRKSVLLLLDRSFTNLWRQPVLLTNRFSQGIFYALILCCFYAPLGDDQASVQNRIGILYELTALCFIGMLSCVAIFPSERDVFLREYADGYYPSLAFALSYFCIALPILVATTLALSALVVFSVGLQTTFVAFAEVSYCVFAFLFVGEAIGVAFCSAFIHIGFSVNIMSVVISFLGIMAGYISLNMPLFLEGLSCISPLKWGAFLLTNIVFKGQSFSCDDDSTTSTTCLATGEDVLDLYDMNPGNGTRSMGFHYLMLAVVTIGYFLLALLAVRLRARQASH